MVSLSLIMVRIVVHKEEDIIAIISIIINRAIDSNKIMLQGSCKERIMIMLEEEISFLRISEMTLGLCLISIGKSFRQLKGNL